MWRMARNDRKEGLAMVVKEGIPSYLDNSPQNLWILWGQLVGIYRRTTFFALTVRGEWYNIARP
jgi:hypothetical protein